MSELSALIAQLTGSNQQSAPDPALAAVKLARASIDALVLKLGQSIDARVVGQLAAGLTELAAGNESFVLKLETPLPPGTAVTIKVAPNPRGGPAVTVSVPAAAPQVARPLAVPTPASPLVPAQAQATPQATPPTSQPLQQATQLPIPEPATPAAAPSPAASASGTQSTTQPNQPQAVPSQPQTMPAQPQASPSPQPAQQPGPGAVAQPVATSPQPAAPKVAAQVAVGQPLQPQAAQASSPPLPAAQPPAAAPQISQATPPLPAPGQPAAPVALPVTPPVTATVAVQPATAAQPPAPPAQAVAVASMPLSTAQPPAQSAIVATQPPAAAPQPAQPPGTPVTAQPQQPLPAQPSPYPVRLPGAGAGAAPQQLPLPVTARAATPPLNLADPAQAAARQDSAAPLLARLAVVVTAAAPSLPRPVIEMALKVLANRVDLNRGPPDAKTLEAAVLKAGVLLTPPSREPGLDSKSGLLALRSALLGFLGGDATAPLATAERPAPPIKGEPPRAPPPQGAMPDPGADGHDTARALLGHTDAALSRLKLLQSASQPPDIRADAPPPRNELRVEIPMLLGAQTGILQLMVERDAKHKREPERQRGWRMRFAMNFSATGEVGADIALLGHSASISIWAADPDTADALDEMLPELSPAIQRHGLELTSLRVRRGAPQQARTAPGRLLDSAR